MVNMGNNPIKHIIDMFNSSIPKSERHIREYTDGLSIEEYLEMKRCAIDE